MSLKRRSAAVFCAAVLASSAILGSSGIAFAEDPSEETKENIVAVAGEYFLENLGLKHCFCYPRGW